ncbi:MAG: hypothetical protein H7A46_25770 [Verrucomicrobiales bacterium]|nr:hypothetical protein [Verrucomicrobiales bacterium]
MLPLRHCLDCSTIQAVKMFGEARSDKSGHDPNSARIPLSSGGTPVDAKARPVVGAILVALEIPR